MKRLLTALIALCLLGGVVIANGERADGANEILAVVNGQAITYQEIVGDSDMQTEISTTRASQRVPATVSDKEIEKQLVSQRLISYVLQKLLDAEADRVQLKISDSQMRAVLMRERKYIGLADSDVRGWASYLKEKYNLTPGEYRERRRGEIRRNEVMNYMAGAYGPLPPQFPLEIYFSMSVSPADLREEFAREADQWRIARNIDYRRFRLLYPSETSLDAVRKLQNAVIMGDTSVLARVQKNESLENASEGLIKLIEDLALPGVKLELGDRTTARDDSELDVRTYQMALSVPATGGISDPGYAEDEDADGQKLIGMQFVQLYSREDGDRRDFESPKVQEGLRVTIENQRFVQNRSKVEQALLKRAAIVPEKLFVR
ncbi:MAG: SurA N-terminal domain-containing protein [Planctomycetes bacterium]|nr:SurA N-terminal domain-containing protein [Planctomycetota bacterium]